MTTKINTAEGGTNGATVVSGTSGGGSGDAFNAVQIDAGTTVTYSSTQKAHGSLSYHLNTTTGLNAYVQLALTTAQPQGYASLYLYVTALPAANVNFFRLFGSANNNGSISLTTAGALQVFNSVGSSIGTIPGFVMPTGKWVRIEFAPLITSATVGQLEVRIFSTDPEAYTPDYTYTTAATVNAGTSISTVRAGIVGTTNSDLYIDTIRISDSNYPGPYAPSDALAVGQLATFG